MRLQEKKSNSGNLKEAVSGFNNPDLLVFISNDEQFEGHVTELEELFPGVPSIGTTGHFYDDKITEGGVGVVAFFDVKASSGVLTKVSTAPITDIMEFKANLQKVGPGANDTACINFSTGNDAVMLTTVDSILKPAKVVLTGGTAFNGKVSVNGKVYEDADAYAFVKNPGGVVKAYKENIYRAAEHPVNYIASKTNHSDYYIGELNGIPAKKVYMDALGISESQIATQTFRNPFGKVTGDDICIISIKEVKGNGICCYRQVNDSDVLTILETGDFRQIARDTADQIKSDFRTIQGSFGVNCVFRYFFFNDNNFMDEYLRIMSQVNNFCGFVGNGEHCNSQFINQSMSCVVFGEGR